MAAVGTPREFGLELCLKAHSEDIKNRKDVLICLCHWRMLRHALLCVGDGGPDLCEAGGSVAPSELLPLNLGWDGAADRYSVRYSFKSRPFTLTLWPGAGGQVELSLQSAENIVSIKADTETSVDDHMVVNMHNCHDLCKRIDSELIEQALRSSGEPAGPLP